MNGKQMREAMSRAKRRIPKGWGLTILAYPLGSNNGMANYISDSRREDMIKFLRDTADRLDKGEEFKTPEPHDLN